MGKFSLARPEGVCAVDGKPIGEGDEFYAVVFEDGEGLRREDYCLDCWKAAPEGSLCSFKTRLPEKSRPKRLLVDDQILVQFFERLDDATEPARLNFRFVLALILMRKRLLKYETTELDAQGREFWGMSYPKGKGAVRVLNPRLNEEQICSISAQLGAVLQGDFDAVDATVDGDADSNADV